ncbi:hypothetical protein [Aurantiacibacter luteus]|uniref:hypothetical protein n=1 Tax=Aurantiacibacter luteus TaxID=1581420 RepID=UPI0012E02202|nr:hypothetical protein [Aurantiacibacter luteus]
MIAPLAFLLLLAIALGFGGRAGDPADRPAILAIGTAAILTCAAQLFLHFYTAQLAVAGIDVLLLGYIWWHAFRSHRYWPIWFAGCMITVVTFDICALVLPYGERSLFLVASAFWALPALVVLVIGVSMDQRITNKVR